MAFPISYGQIKHLQSNFSHLFEQIDCVYWCLTVCVVGYPKDQILPSEKFEYNLLSRPEDNRGMISFLCFTTVIYSKPQAVKMLLHPVFALVFHSENLITADTPGLLVILNNCKPLYTMVSQEIKLRIQFPMSWDSAFNWNAFIWFKQERTATLLNG